MRGSSWNLAVASAHCPAVHQTTAAAVMSGSSSVWVSRAPSALNFTKVRFNAGGFAVWAHIGCGGPAVDASCHRPQT